MTDPRMRASDADRQATVDRLAAGFTAGRLTAAEYDERVQRAYATTYLDELPGLTADLPASGPSAGHGFWGDPHTLGADAAYGRGAGGDFEAGSGSAGSGWGGGDERDGWGRGRWDGDRWQRLPRRRVRLVPLIVLAVVLVGLSHGFVLIPLFWIGLAVLFIGRRRRGRCASRFGPHGAR